MAADDAPRYSWEDQFDSFSKTVLRVKKERDEYLEVLYRIRELIAAAIDKAQKRVDDVDVPF
jgi:hypothetical protein